MRIIRDEKKEKDSNNISLEKSLWIQLFQQIGFQNCIRKRRERNGIKKERECSWFIFKESMFLYIIYKNNLVVSPNLKIYTNF